MNVGSSKQLLLVDAAEVGLLLELATDVQLELGVAREDLEQEIEPLLDLAPACEEQEPPPRRLKVLAVGDATGIRKGEVVERVDAPVIDLVPRPHRVGVSDAY